MFERIRHRVTTIHADRQTLVAEAGTTAMGRKLLFARRDSGHPAAYLPAT